MQRFLEKYLMIVCLLLPPVDSLWAQADGTVRGRILDGSTAEPLFGAAVMVREQNVFVQTDFEGRYQLQLPPGQHEMLVQMIGYSDQRRTITVVAGGNLAVNLTMGIESLDTVVVEGRAINDTEASMLAMQRRAGSVSDGISAEAISRSPDSSAGDVLRRVTGITLVDGRYVYVRGLGERYSNTQLNNAILPSPEPDRRVIPLDLFPASLIKNIIVVKSFLPEYPGEFSGGLVRIDTKEYPDEFEASVSVGLGGNYNTTGRHFQSPRGGNMDFLGLHNDYLGLADDTRSIPGLVEGMPTGFPFIEGNPLTGGLSRDMVKLGALQFNNDWAPQTINAPFDRDIKFSIGDTVEMYGMKFGYLFGTSYNRKWRYREITERRYRAGNLLPG